MSVEENKALVRREQAELWNHTGNLDAAAELFAPDRVEDAKQEAASVRRGFPDLELPSIGWQLFILDSSQSDPITLPAFLDTYATRLLTEPLRKHHRGPHSREEQGGSPLEGPGNPPRGVHGHPSDRQ